jgi:ATP-dependent Clp protease ATP-binding subunit ClpA
MLKITQILLQSQKNNLDLVGDPGVGKRKVKAGWILKGTRTALKALDGRFQFCEQSAS